MKSTITTAPHPTLSNILERIIPRGKSLYNRFINVISNYRLGYYDKLGVDAGKFVEEFVKIIAEKEGVNYEYNVRKTITTIKNTLANRKDPLAKEKGVMLEIAYYSIYGLRNIRDVAHANPSKLSDWDARHIIESSIWLLEEFLRLYGGLEEEEIINIFYPFTIPYETLKVVEVIDGKLIPLKSEMSGKELVLYALFSSNDCLLPKDIINSIDGIKPSTIYVHLRNLAKEGLIVRLNNKDNRRVCYKITSKGKKYIFSIMSDNKKFSKLRVSFSKKIEALMEDALEGFIGLDEDTKDVVVGPYFSKCKISNDVKVLIAVLAYKVMNIIGWKETDTVSPKEIADKFGIKHNSVRPILLKLYNQGLLRRINGAYSINSSRIEEISEIIRNAKKECKQVEGNE